MSRRHNLQSFSRKWVIYFPIYYLLYVKFLRAEVYHIFNVENRRHIRFKFRGVFSADAEYDNCSGISKCRRLHPWSQLSEILMGNSNAKSVFSRFRKKIFKRIGDDVMELVHIKIKIFASFLFLPRARHTGLFHFGKKHRTEKTRIFFSKASLGKIDKNYLFLVHQFLDVYFIFFLAENITQKRIGKKLP